MLSGLPVKFKERGGIFGGQEPQKSVQVHTQISFCSLRKNSNILVHPSVNFAPTYGARTLVYTFQRAASRSQIKSNISSMLSKRQALQVIAADK